MNNKENILDFIFNARSEELAKVTKEDKEFLNSPKVDAKKDYQNFKDTLKYLSAEQKSNIIEKVDKYCDTNDLIHAYYYKKYYKMGFSECMKLILNCLNS